jgi:hypothetical protein
MLDCPRSSPRFLALDASSRACARGACATATPTAAERPDRRPAAGRKARPASELVVTAMNFLGVR